MDIDIHLDGSWQSCAAVQLEDPLRTSQADGVSLRYDADYALEHLYHQGLAAVSVRWPVDLAVRRLASWPMFLADLLPRGEARARLQRRDGGVDTDWSQLQAVVNPAGNFRVRPLKPRPRGTHSGFELEEIAEHGGQFIDHAAEAGAQVIGATDVAGEAPKFWAVETDQGKWLPDDGRLGDRARRHMLIKFPDPAAGPQACDILRQEAAYQRVAQAYHLYVAPKLPQFLNGMLLLHRFDRQCSPQGEVRLGVESLRSLIGDLERPPTHLDALVALRSCVSDFERDLLEYLRRDILNLALGNRDNEPGNSAVLKDVDGSIRLAPLYDVGPSFLDVRPMRRTLRWPGEGDTPMDWDDILARIAEQFAALRLDPGDLAQLAERLREFAQDLRRLPQLMGEAGVDDAVIGQRRRPIETLARALRELSFR